MISDSMTFRELKIKYQNILTMHYLCLLYRLIKMTCFCFLSLMNFPPTPPLCSSTVYCIHLMITCHQIIFPINNFNCVMLKCTMTLQFNDYNDIWI